jgi:hypothetical protein
MENWYLLIKMLCGQIWVIKYVTRMLAEFKKCVMVAQFDGAAAGRIILCMAQRHSLTIKLLEYYNLVAYDTFYNHLPPLLYCAAMKTWYCSITQCVDHVWLLLCTVMGINLWRWWQMGLELIVGCTGTAWWWNWWTALWSLYDRFYTNPPVTLSFLVHPKYIDGGMLLIYIWGVKGSTVWPWLLMVVESIDWGPLWLGPLSNTVAHVLQHIKVGI